MKSCSKLGTDAPFACVITLAIQGTASFQEGMLGNAPELKGPGVGWYDETFGSWSLSCDPCMLAVASWSVLQVLASES